MPEDFDDTKPCGCSLRAIKCEHFANGSRLFLLELADIIDKANAAMPLGIKLTRFCIQYEPAEYGPVCTGTGHTEDQSEAEEAYAEYADHLYAHPEAGELAGAIVFEVSING